MGHLESMLRRLPFVRVAEPVRFPAGSGAGSRAAPRRPVEAGVEVREADSDAEPLPLELAEISATGAFVRSDLLLPIGSAIEVSFRLDDEAPAIRARGRVVRVDERPDGAGMGIEFERMPGPARATLRQYTHWT